MDDEDNASKKRWGWLKNQLTGMEDEQEKERLMAESIETRDEINRLRAENKALARQLHIDRYTSKSRNQDQSATMKRDISQLQVRNSKLEARISAINKNLESKQKQVQEKKGKYDLKMAERDRLEAKLDDVSTMHENYRLKSEDIQDSVRFLKEEALSIVARKDVLRSQIEDEYSLCKDLKDTSIKAHTEKDNLQGKFVSRQKGVKLLIEKRMEISKQREYVEENENADLERQLESINADIEKIKEKIARSVKEADQLRAKSKKHLQAYDALVEEMRDPPSNDGNTQTDPIELEFPVQGTLKWDSAFEAEARGTSRNKGDFRGDIVRCTGVGGNVKKKFGKDLEVRATNYSNYLNFSVKVAK